MSANIQDILKSYGPIGVDVLKKAIQQVEATGKTGESIRFEVESTETKDKLLLIGRAFFELIEKGRRPTDKGPSPEMISFLEDYARVRGMDNPKSAAWGIAKKINREGDSTYRRGGRLVYSPDLLKFVEELTEVIKKQFAKDYLTNVVGAFKRGSIVNS